MVIQNIAVGMRGQPNTSVSDDEGLSSTLNRYFLLFNSSDLLLVWIAMLPSYHFRKLVLLFLNDIQYVWSCGVELLFVYIMYFNVTGIYKKKTYMHSPCWHCWTDPALALAEADEVVKLQPTTVSVSFSWMLIMQSKLAYNSKYWTFNPNLKWKVVLGNTLIFFV